MLDCTITYVSEIRWLHFELETCPKSDDNYLINTSEKARIEYVVRSNYNSFPGEHNYFKNAINCHYHHFFKCF